MSDRFSATFYRDAVVCEGSTYRDGGLLSESPRTGVASLPRRAAVLLAAGAVVALPCRYYYRTVSTRGGPARTPSRSLRSASPLWRNQQSKNNPALRHGVDFAPHTQPFGAGWPLSRRPTTSPVATPLDSGTRHH